MTWHLLTLNTLQLKTACSSLILAEKTSFYTVIQVYVQSDFKRRLLIFLVTVIHPRDRSLRTRSYIGLSWEK